MEMETETELVIEKLTFYKLGYAPSRSVDQSSGHKMIQISLPRVRWLETDGPYRPSWAVDKPVEASQAVSTGEPKKRDNETRFYRIKKDAPLTDMERTAGDLWREGKSTREISNHLGVKIAAAKDAVYRFKCKSGLATTLVKPT